MPFSIICGKGIAMCSHPYQVRRQRHHPAELPGPLCCQSPLISNSPESHCPLLFMYLKLLALKKSQAGCLILTPLVKYYNTLDQRGPKRQQRELGMVENESREEKNEDKNWKHKKLPVSKAIFFFL